MGLLYIAWCLPTTLSKAVLQPAGHDRWKARFPPHFTTGHYSSCHPLVSEGSRCASMLQLLEDQNSSAHSTKWKPVEVAHTWLLTAAIDKKRDNKSHSVEWELEKCWRGNSVGHAPKTLYSAAVNHSSIYGDYILSLHQCEFWHLVLILVLFFW